MNTTKKLWVTGLCGLLLFGSGWSAKAAVFRDDFNRPNMSGNPVLGPGWLSGTNSTAPYFLDTWNINSGRGQISQAGSFAAYATNFVLSTSYSMGLDVFYTGSVFNSITLFGNTEYMVTSNSLQAIYHPSLNRLLLRRTINGTNSDTVAGFGSFVANQFYRITLTRTNDAARATLVGPNVNIDSGWLSIAGVVGGGYGGIFVNSFAYFDNFELEAVPEPNIVALGLLGVVIAAHVRRSRSKR